MSTTCRMHYVGLYNCPCWNHGHPLNSPSSELQLPVCPIILWDPTRSLQRNPVSSKTKQNFVLSPWHVDHAAQHCISTWAFTVTLSAYCKNSSVWLGTCWDKQKWKAPLRSVYWGIKVVLLTLQCGDQLSTLTWAFGQLKQIKAPFKFRGKAHQVPLCMRD